MNNWYFLLLVPSVLWLMQHNIRKRRLLTFLELRGTYHDDKFWLKRYPQYQSEKLMEVISEMSGALGVPQELINPEDKLSEITVNDALSSDELDHAALLLVKKYGVNKNELEKIVTVDDYVRTALESSVRW